MLSAAPFIFRPSGKVSPRRSSTHVVDASRAGIHQRHKVSPFRDAEGIKVLRSWDQSYLWSTCCCRLIAAVFGDSESPFYCLGCVCCCCCCSSPSSQMFFIENVTEALQRSYTPNQACEGTNTCRCMSDSKHLAKVKGWLPISAQGSFGKWVLVYYSSKQTCQIIR